MPPLIGYAVLPWEMESGFKDPTAIARGFREIKEAGFDAVEVLAGTTLGLDYGRRVMHFVEWPWPPEFRTDMTFTSRMGTVLRESRAAGLQLTNIFCDGEYVNPNTTQAEIDQAVVIAHISKTSGAEHLLVTGGGRRPGSKLEEDVRRLAEVFSELGEKTLEVGVQLCAHPHVDTALERPEEIELFFELADPTNVAFGFDTAHVTAGGGDAVQMLERYVERVKYVHIKDIRMPETVGPEFTGPARFAAFCDLGAGSVDFPGVWGVLRGAGYDGPLIVELDSTPDPGESARIARRYLSETLGI